MNEEENPLIAEPRRGRLSLAEKKGKEDKKGRERLARKHAEGLEKNDKGSFTEQDDFFFFFFYSESYILIDH